MREYNIYETADMAKSGTEAQQLKRKNSYCPPYQAPMNSHPGSTRKIVLYDKTGAVDGTQVAVSTFALMQLTYHSKAAV